MEKIEMAPIRKCVNCGCDQLNLYLEAEDFHTHTGKYSILVCNNCDTGHTSPRPTPLSLPKLYESKVAGVDISTRSRIAHTLRKIKLSGYARRIFRLSKKKSCTVYDVGCGDGLLTYTLANSPLCSTAIALDFSSNPPDLIQSERLPNLRYVPFNSVDTANLPKADLIILRHVLEHVLDPLTFLKVLSKHLKDDGKFIIEIPNRDSIWLKIFGQYYNQLAPPYHLSHFTEKSFRKTFEGRFPILSVTHVNIPVLGPSISTWLGFWNGNINILAALLYPIQLIIDRICRSSTALLIEMGPAQMD